MAHFLIVDDEPDLVRQMTALLERAKHTVAAASDGSEVLQALGLEKAEAALPDVVILDVMMPRENGYKVCARLKDDPRKQDIPLIVLTGYTDFKEAFDKFPNVAAFLPKPFEPAQLLNTLADVLYASRTKRPQN